MNLTRQSAWIVDASGQVVELTHAVAAAEHLGEATTPVLIGPKGQRPPAAMVAAGKVPDGWRRGEVAGATVTGQGHRVVLTDRRRKQLAGFTDSLVAATAGPGTARPQREELNRIRGQIFTLAETRGPDRVMDAFVKETSEFRGRSAGLAALVRRVEESTPTLADLARLREQGTARDLHRRSPTLAALEPRLGAKSARPLKVANVSGHAVLRTLERVTRQLDAADHATILDAAHRGPAAVAEAISAKVTPEQVATTYAMVARLIESGNATFAVDDARQPTPGPEGVTQFLLHVSVPSTPERPVSPHLADGFVVACSAERMSNNGAAVEVSILTVMTQDRRLGWVDTGDGWWKPPTARAEAEARAEMAEGHMEAGTDRAIARALSELADKGRRRLAAKRQAAQGRG